MDITVTRVIDGDTLDVAAADGSQDRIRLLGVDTPALRGPNKPNENGANTYIGCPTDLEIPRNKLPASK